MRALEYIEIDADEYAAVDRTAAFDGTNDYLTRGAGLTGAADSKLWTGSLWIWPDNAGSGNRWLFEDSGAESTRLVLISDNTFEITAVNAAGTIILRASSSVILRPNRWHHVMFSVDLSDEEKRWLVINDQVDLTASWQTYTDDTIDFTESNWSIGAQTDGSNKFFGFIGDFWMEDGVYIDLSREHNRRKFISPRQGPVDLGANGENPTGTSPIIFLSGATSGWHTNKGTGGGFTENGELGLAGYIGEVWRFAVPTDYLPNDIPAIASISGINVTPATVSLGKDLGQRASVSVTLKDHRYKFASDNFADGTFWGKWRARYGTKFRNKEFRLIRGFEGQSLSQMFVEYYSVDTTDGPTPQGNYSIIAKDILKLADDDRSQAPIISNGRLAGSIDASTTSITLVPTGIGNAEYPASGHVVLGGKEIVSFTRSGDDLTVDRGELGSIATTHNSGDRVQILLRYDGDDVADIIYDLLINYVPGITSDMITLTDWQAETSQFLSVIYAGNITEPTGVRKLLSELIDQASLALYWDAPARQIRLKVLREISTEAQVIDEEYVVEGSLSVKEQPNSRISQLWTFYGERDPTDRGGKEDNFRAAIATVDLAAETAYGAPAIQRVTGRWLATESAAERHNQIKLSRFVDPPRQFAFKTWRDAVLTLAGGYQLEWKQNQDENGLIVPAPIQITSIRREPDFIYVTAEEMLASGVIVLVNVVILTTTGAGQWEVPADWNDAENTISTIGGGGGGATSGDAGAGGGGGAFSQITNANLTPAAMMDFSVGIGGTSSVNGGDTWFGHTVFGSSLVGARGGARGIGRSSPGAGGLASSGIGDLKTSGGDGGFGAPEGEIRAGGGGGGGAGGPNGDGADGGDGDSTGDDGGSGGGAANGGSPGISASGSGGGNGGNNRFNFGGGTDSQPSGQEGGGGQGGDNNFDGAPGGDGEQIWTQTVAPIISAGPGGGGGGGGDDGDGGRGGKYGGAGGGGGDGGVGGPGEQGAIIIRWRDPS